MKNLKYLIVILLAMFLTTKINAVQTYTEIKDNKGRIIKQDVSENNKKIFAYLFYYNTDNTIIKAEKFD